MRDQLFALHSKSLLSHLQQERVMILHEVHAREARASTRTTLQQVLRWQATTNHLSAQIATNEGTLLTPVSGYMDSQMATEALKVHLKEEKVVAEARNPNGDVANMVVHMQTILAETEVIFLTR